MEYKFEISFSRGLIETTIRQIWFKWCIKPIFIEIGLLIYALVTWFLWGIKDCWVSSTLAALAITAIVIEIAVYFVYRQRSISLFEKMESPKAIWSFDENFIGVTADTGNAKYKWAIIKKLWRLPKAWVFEYVNHTVSILAIDSIPSEVQEFIIKKIKENKGKIV